MSRSAKILSYKKSIDLLNKDTRLTRSGKIIAKKILEFGRIFMYQFSPGAKHIPILDVHYILNHRVEPKLMELIGIDLAKILKPFSIDLIITAATSGIAPTQVTSKYLNYIPYIYARKEVPITFRNHSFKASSFSITSGRKVELCISTQCLNRDTNIAIVDDFLDMAILAKNLINVINQANCNLKALAFIIEKSQNGGRRKLRQAGIPNNRIFSLLNITEMEPGMMKIAEIPYWLSLKNK